MANELNINMKLVWTLHMNRRPLHMDRRTLYVDRTTLHMDRT